MTVQMLLSHRKTVRLVPLAFVKPLYNRLFFPAKQIQPIVIDKLLQHGVLIYYLENFMIRSHNIDTQSLWLMHPSRAVV